MIQKVKEELKKDPENPVNLAAYTDMSTGPGKPDKATGIKNGWDFHFGDHIILRILMARSFDVKESVTNLR